MLKDMICLYYIETFEHYLKNCFDKLLILSQQQSEMIQS